MGGGDSSKKKDRGRSIALWFMGKLNIELSSNSSQGRKKKKNLDKKPPNGATISDKRDKCSVCASMGCSGPCYVAAARPPPNLPVSGSLRADDAT